MAAQIVIGIDGSRDSQRALQWAYSEARLRRAELVLVHAWEYPVSYETMPPDVGKIHAGILAREAEAVLRRKVPVRTMLIQSRPTPALVDAAALADLLVVGSRGHNRLLRTLLGSVSTGCINHAKCPVVVVRAEPVIAKPAAALNGQKATKNADNQDGSRERPDHSPQSVADSLLRATGAP